MRENFPCRRWLAFCLSFLVTALAAPAATAAPVRVDTVQAELVADSTAVVPGQRLRLGLRLLHDPQWHTYWRNPGDSGLPTQFPLQMPAGFTAGEIQWPFPTRILIPPLANLGYEDDLLLMREVMVPDRIDAGEVRFESLAQWLVCREVCVPGEARLQLVLPVAAQSAPGPHAPAFATAGARLSAAPATVEVARQDDRLQIHLPQALIPADANRLEFFPYRESVVQYAEPQTLLRLPQGQGWRLEVALSPDYTQPPPGLAPVELALAAEGIVVIDERRSVALAPSMAQGGEAFTMQGPSQLIEGHLVPFMAAQQSAASSLLAAGRERAATGAQAGPAVTTAGNGMTPALAPAAPPAPAAGASGIGQSVWMAMGLAMIGGLILNLMPCVFPVIGLKILGFAGSGTGGQEALTLAQRRMVRTGSFWFALGVVVSFWVLAAVLLVLRGAGESIGWGFQLQSPAFVVLMALLFVAIGLNFSGVYEIGARVTQLGNLDAAPSSERGHWGAFGSGALAVLVATPCTAPFMGSALGFTLTQPAAVTMAVFTALGLGMAIPYLLLGVFPGWLRWLPRPGRWMETLKQLLAFPMFAAAAWLTWVLGRQLDADAVLALTMGAVFLASGLWVWGREVQVGRGRARGLAAALAGLLVVGGIVLALPMGDPVTRQQAGREAPAGSVNASDWQPWAPGVVEKALAAGRPVFVDFTAAWCVSCQVNKKLVFETDTIRQRMAEKRVSLVRADWTQRDPAITAELARHGRNSVPLYLLYAPDGQPPQVLPELMTQSIMQEALGLLP